MASPNLDSLFPLLLPSLPECPLDMVRLAVRRASRDFCRVSTAWRVLLDPIAMLDAVREYAMTLPANTEAALICNVYAPVGELVGKTLDQLALDLPDWSSAVGLPRYFNSLDYASLAVYPAPAAVYVGQNYIVRAALVPKLTIADLPDLLTSRYDEALVAGALARLYAISDRPWSRTVGEVTAQKTAFDQLTVAARIAIEHERVRGSLRAQPRRFGA